MKIYLDPEEELRVRWKMHRDTTKRGYTREEVLAQLERREMRQPELHPPAAHLRRHRHPLPAPRGRQRLRHAGSTSAISCGRRCRIPTSPRYSTGPAMPGCIWSLPATATASPSTCLRLTGISPTRGPSGSKICYGTSSPRRASARRGRPHRCGQRRGKSHPLALTQLLVGYHAVKAAMGVRAYLDIHGFGEDRWPKP